MKAEDTVMNFKQMNLLRSTPAVAEAQAEISFPLGKQEGIKEGREKIVREIYLNVSLIGGGTWETIMKKYGLTIEGKPSSKRGG